MHMHVLYAVCGYINFNYYFLLALLKSKQILMIMRYDCNKFYLLCRDVLLLLAALDKPN